MPRWERSPRPPDLLRSSSLRGGQLEDKRDAGTARAGERLHLVRDPPRYPKAVTGQFRKWVQQGRGIRGCDQVAVVDLAVQCPRQMPDPQSPLPAAMAEKPDSQEICFIPGGDYKKFIDAYLEENGEAAPDTEGELVTTSGEVLEPVR